MYLKEIELKTQEIRSSETLVNMYRSKEDKILEHLSIQIKRTPTACCIPTAIVQL
jgi:hypothetical protein